MQLTLSIQQKAGWLYIYKNDQFWREIQIIVSNRCPLLKEVDIPSQAKQDLRIASGEPTHYLTLPRQINNQIIKCNTVFSHIQLSWQQLNQNLAGEPIDLVPSHQTNELST